MRKLPHARYGLTLLTVLLALALAAPAAVFGQASPDELPDEVKINYSLGMENYKNGDYQAARPYVRWLLDNAATLYNGRLVHQRAYDMYTQLGMAAEDEALKEAYRDTALMIMTDAVEKHEEAGVEFDEASWYLSIANYIRENRDFFEGLDPEQTTEYYRMAFDLDPESVDGYYARLIAYGYASLGDKEASVAFMEVAEPHYEDDQETIDWFDTIRGQLFKTPAERIGFLESQLEKKPDDIEIVQELFELYRNVGDTAKLEQIGEQLMEMDPNATVFRLLADAKYNNGDLEGAIELYERALEMAETDEEKRDIQYNMSLAFMDANQLQRARAAAEAATRLDPNFGRAWIQLGDIYVRAVQGSSYDRKDKAVFWLAVDMFEKAGRVDESVKATAQQKANTYRAFFPDQEEKFFEGWKPGQSYSVDYGNYAWISRTTTVR